MRTPPSLAAIVISIVTATAIAFGQTQTSDVLLGGIHSDAAMSAVSKAAAAHQTELLFVAMHNKSSNVQMFCLDQTNMLTRREQAQLVARVLLDDDLLYRRNEVPPFGAEDSIRQYDLQQKLQQIAYKLLGTNQQPRGDFLTRKEASDLAERLNKVSN